MSFGNSLLSNLLSLLSYLGDILTTRDQTIGLKQDSALQAIDYGAASAWSTLSADKMSLALKGLTTTALGGQLSQYNGATVLSANDVADIAAGKGWVKEIDAFNDTREGVKMTFETAQKSVALTLYSTYVESVFVTEPEKVDYVITYTDGTVGRGTATATQMTQPGELALTIDQSITGGKFIAAIEVTPNLSLPTLPAGVVRGTVPYESARLPFSEFTLKAVSYTADTTIDTGKNLCLKGGFGNDLLVGGKGYDSLWGNWGNDTLYGGAGDNYLYGGKGCDTFLFDWRSTGDTTIGDFTRGQDHLKLADGMVVTGMAVDGWDTILTLSNGGHIELTGVTGITDWHSLL